MFPIQLFPLQLFPNGLFDRSLTFDATKYFTDTLFFTESIVVIGPGIPPIGGVVNITDNLFFIDTASTVPILDEIADGPFPIQIFPDQVFSYHIFPRIDFVQGVNTYPILIIDSLNFEDTYTGIKPSIFDQTLTDNLFFDDYSLQRLDSNHYYIYDRILFTEELNYAFPPKYTANLIDELFFEETLSQQLDLNIHILDQLNFIQDKIKKNIQEGYITIPGPIVTVITEFQRKNRYVKLQSTSGVIILPPPLFGDTQTNVTELKINRAVTGKVYTFVKRTQRERLSYKFEMRRQKSNELQFFLDDENLNWMYLTNWRGEIFYVRLVNNPVVYTAVSRDGYCTRNLEKHEVELEFEGYSLTHQLSPCD